MRKTFKANMRVMGREKINEKDNKQIKGQQKYKWKHLLKKSSKTAVAMRWYRHDLRKEQREENRMLRWKTEQKKIKSL